MKLIITGSAGFIGCNAVRRHMAPGNDAVVVDELSRPGSVKNLAWLQGQGRSVFERCDIRDWNRLSDIIGRHKDASAVLHLAAQVAVTTSVTDPRSDFEVNALGTFNLLEAVRLRARDATASFSSSVASRTRIVQPATRLNTPRIASAECRA